jgi:hypothetical protein
VKETNAMNDRKKKLLEQSKRDVAKAGTLFFDAIFGDSKRLVEEFEREREEHNEPCDDDNVLTVEGYEMTDDEKPPSTKPYGSRR